MNWTEGRALVATGTPFPDVLYGGRRIRIGNCNNAFIFPGLALGTIACGAREISDEMISAAGIELAKWSCCGGDPHSPLMPTLDDVLIISNNVAIAVAVAAQKQGLAEKTSLEELEAKVSARKWKGDYCRYRRGKG
jgi:malate dehydrogenase (oxaloacetate-decarboxylating)